MNKRMRIGLVAVLGVSFFFYSSKLADDYFEISKNLDIFANIYKQLNIYYVDDTQPGQLMKTGIDAMLESLDPYTVYYPESEIEDYRFMTTGEYGGIGALIRRRGDRVMVAEPYEGFPAQKNGLMAGDILLKIDGKDLTGKNTSQISSLLKGQAKTDVEVVYSRDGEESTATLARENIKIKDVPYYGMLTDKVGYIKLTGFTETASSEFVAAFKDLKNNQGMESLVFDLRGNGGGLLNEAVNIVNVFVDRGQEVVYTRGKLKEWDRSHRALNNAIDKDIPIVVLINGSSASASEIVSGTIQDLDRGVLVGERSFGKGLVQQTKPLSYNSQLKVTVAKYYIPSGRCIQKLDYSKKSNGKATEVPDSLRQTFYTKGGRPVKDGKGIEPDVEVELPDAANITASLVGKDFIFDFATEYRRSHDTLIPANKFVVGDDLYGEFVQYLDGKDYDYTTRSERLLEQFKEASEKDHYFEQLKEEYEELHSKMSHNKSEDLQLHQEEIREILANEIVSRYFYQTGRIENSLSLDIQVNKAIEVLESPEEYKQILTAKKSGGKEK
ncbi:S41 family peptidase [bacterium SCSIO 12741]|nr:S41 family peptidase [bacterium SCSIO 12741]